MAGWFEREVSASQIAEGMEDNAVLRNVAQLPQEELQSRIDDVEQKQKQVEAALQGCGSYLGVNDHDGLISTLHNLRKKEEQLREEQRLLLRTMQNNSSNPGSSDGDSPVDGHPGDDAPPTQGWTQRGEGDVLGSTQERQGISSIEHADGSSNNGGGRGNVAQTIAAEGAIHGTTNASENAGVCMGMGVDVSRAESGPNRPVLADDMRITTAILGSSERPNEAGASGGSGAQGATAGRQSDEETEDADVDVLAVEGRAQKRYKRSEKIDVEDPTTWTKGQLRCALSACGMPSVCRIKAAGRDGQQQLARLVAQFWGSPRKKLLSQQAAVGMAGEGFDPGPLSATWNAADGRNSGGSSSGLTNLDLQGLRAGGTVTPADESGRKDDQSRRTWMYRQQGDPESTTNSPGVPGVQSKDGAENRAGNSAQPAIAQETGGAGTVEGPGTDFVRETEAHWGVDSVRHLGSVGVDEQGASSWVASKANAAASPIHSPSLQAAPLPSVSTPPPTGGEADAGTLDMLGLESLPPRRYKRSEKIDVEDPFTWSKGQLRCALYACGVPNVKNIKAPGREGQQHLARLVFGLWGSPKRKVMSQKAAIGMTRKSVGGISGSGIMELDADGTASSNEAGDGGALQSCEANNVTLKSENGEALLEERREEEMREIKPSANSLPRLGGAEHISNNSSDGGSADASGATSSNPPAERTEKLEPPQEQGLDVGCPNDLALGTSDLSDIVRPPHLNATPAHLLVQGVTKTEGATKTEGDISDIPRPMFMGKALNDGDALADGAAKITLGVKPHPPKRKRSEKIDIEAPSTWTKGQLRCALSACGVSNVKGIKAPGRDGQQHLARLVAQFWGTPRKKLFAQKAAVSFVGESFDPGPAAWNLGSDDSTPGGAARGSAVPNVGSSSARQADSKRSSHVPEGAVAKLQELIASFGLENAMAQQFVSYQGSKYIMSDVLRLINRDVRQLQVKSQDGNVVGPAVSDTPTGEALAGKNGIFRLLNIIFQERTRQMWIECEQRVTNTPATPNRGTLGRCWEPFWTAVTQHLLDKEYDAGGLLPGSGELLAGVDPRVVDLPASTAPNEVMHMYTTTRSAYNVTKADHNLSADGPGHFRPFMSGKPDVWYLFLWIQSTQGDMEAFCEAMLASAGASGLVGADLQIIGTRTPAAVAPSSVPDAKGSVRKSSTDATLPVPSPAGAVTPVAPPPTQDGAACTPQVSSGLSNLGSPLTPALGSRRQGSVDVAPAEHVVKAELEVRAWEAHSALSTTLEEEEAKPERQRNAAKIAYLRARVKALFDDIVAAAPVR